MFILIVFFFSFRKMSYIFFLIFDIIRLFICISYLLIYQKKMDGIMKPILTHQIRRYGAWIGFSRI